ncbi:MAG: hypothetical protein AB1724_09520 [Thermodesulfobacteriota bacterium]
MFIDFFYRLKEINVPVTPTSFMTLHRAFAAGLVNSLDEFYTTSRTILIKSERYFDLFDQMFAHYFKGADLPDADDWQMDEIIRGLLEEWLKDPRELADMLGMDPGELAKMTPEEVVEYFKQRLKDQTERHDGGNRWIGTGGTSPVGHSGRFPGGMRVGGASGGKSAVKVALERRYKDYSRTGPLTQAQVGEALKRLRNLIPSGPMDQVNVDKSIYQTVRNGGEIEIVFDRNLKDRLKVILAIDNGGWSMDPYVEVVQTLFDYAKAQFKDVKTYFFHNTIYDNLWKDHTRYKEPHKVSDFIRLDPDTRLILVGDASMAPYELMARDGSIYMDERSRHASIDQLKFLANLFPHRAWLNPVPGRMWNYTHTIQVIQQIFPMFELSLDGLEEAVSHLMAK